MRDVAYMHVEQGPSCEHSLEVRRTLCTVLLTVIVSCKTGRPASLSSKEPLVPRVCRKLWPGGGKQAGRRHTHDVESRTGCMTAVRLTGHLMPRGSSITWDMHER